MAAPFRIALIAAAAALAAATPAPAAERCVDPERDECHATVAEAVAAADSNDSIVVAGEHTAAEFSDAGKTLWIRGLAGAAAARAAAAAIEAMRNGAAMGEG